MIAAILAAVVVIHAAVAAIHAALVSWNQASLVGVDVLFLTNLPGDCVIKIGGNVCVKK